MKKSNIKSLIFIFSLIAITCGVLVYTGQAKQPINSGGVSNEKPLLSSKGNGPIGLSGHLVQSKIFTGGDGKAGISLTLKAADIASEKNEKNRNVDMVIVLDRSGSMDGEKISNALHAVRELVSELSPEDRFALVSYSSNVHKHSELIPMTGANREKIMYELSRIGSGGGTNLGAGLQMGVGLMARAENKGNLGRLILISDGLANEGIVDPESLGKIASAAVKNEFVLSTAGVGNDFNEQLMTSLADRGTGSYYYLENPAKFARIFQNEYRESKTTIASSLSLEIPLPEGGSLLDVSGYPVNTNNGIATVYPGDLRSGQTRTLFLTFKLPVHEAREFNIRNIKANYLFRNTRHVAAIEDAFTISCVKTEKDAFASIKKGVWEKKVLRDDYNKLRREVAMDIKAGRKEEAKAKIDTYRNEQESVNRVIQSALVEENLTKDLVELDEMVTHTFSGAAPEVATKQKRNAKAIQYKAYKEQRMK